MKNQLYLPCLRGKLGDRLFYSCVMTLKDVAERVTYAEVLHDSKKLSDMIQRALDEGRGKKIQKYLMGTDERFFNSMVVAVYGGDPEWYGIGKISSRGQKKNEISNIPEPVMDSIGILSFSGKEKLYALDGQHRLSGIQKAVKKQPELGDEEVSILFVAHKKTRIGKMRSRRLFTVLNKTAKAVSKGEIVALDEDDTMAIITRRLIEENKFFNNDKISFTKTANMPASNTTSLTTIINLYDILNILYTKVIFKKKNQDLKFNRPDDDILDVFYKSTCEYFDELAKKFKPLQEYAETNSLEDVISKYRYEDGGHILFRPIGLSIVTDVISRLVKKHTWEEAISIVSRIPKKLEESPFRDVIWNPAGKTIISKGKNLAIRLVLYMLGDDKGKAKLLTDLTNFLGKEHGSVCLPNRVDL